MALVVEGHNVDSQSLAANGQEASAPSTTLAMGESQVEHRDWVSAVVANISINNSNLGFQGKAELLVGQEDMSLGISFRETEATWVV